MKQTLFCNVEMINEYNVKNEKRMTKRVSNRVEKMSIFFSHAQY